MLGQQHLEVGLHPVLVEAGVGSHLVAGVADHLLEMDQQRLALGIGDRPLLIGFVDVLGAFIQLSGL